MPVLLIFLHKGNTKLTLVLNFYVIYENVKTYISKTRHLFYASYISVSSKHCRRFRKNIEIIVEKNVLLISFNTYTLFRNFVTFNLDIYIKRVYVKRVYHIVRL